MKLKTASVNKRQVAIAGAASIIKGRFRLLFALCSCAVVGVVSSAAAPFTFSYTAGSLGSVRFNHTATLLQNGKVLVAGGGNSGSSPFLSTAELFDPANGNWSATGSMGSPRAYHTATMLPNGKVLVAGGFGATTYLATAELYDPAS